MLGCAQDYMQGPQAMGYTAPTGQLCTRFLTSTWQNHSPISLAAPIWGPLAHIRVSHGTFRHPHPGASNAAVDVKQLKHSLQHSMAIGKQHQCFGIPAGASLQVCSASAIQLVAQHGMPQCQQAFGDQADQTCIVWACLARFIQAYARLTRLALFGHAWQDSRRRAPG